jgi:hypothetical protein
MTSGFGAKVLGWWICQQIAILAARLVNKPTRKHGEFVRTLGQRAEGLSPKFARVHIKVDERAHWRRAELPGRRHSGLGHYGADKFPTSSAGSARES